MHKCNSYRAGFRKGVEHWSRRLKGERDLENPFEPDYIEYDAYFDGVVYAESESDSLKNKILIEESN